VPPDHRLESRCSPNLLPSIPFRIVISSRCARLNGEMSLFVINGVVLMFNDASREANSLAFEKSNLASPFSES
jgi:hypothetical protein